MANLATDNGVKKPERMPSEIINAAVEDKMVLISGTSNQRLETVVRYHNRNKIQVRGESWFKKNFDNLATDAVETLIQSREKAILDGIKKQEMSEKNEAFLELVARGVSKDEAYTKVYGQ